MIIQAICGDEKCLYSGGYDNKVKGWTNFDQSSPKALGEVEVGNCVNALVCGANNQVYIGTSDGIVRRATFL